MAVMATFAPPVPSCRLSGLANTTSIVTAPPSPLQRQLGADTLPVHETLVADCSLQVAPVTPVIESIFEPGGGLQSNP